MGRRGTPRGVQRHRKHLAVVAIRSVDDAVTRRHRGDLAVPLAERNRGASWGLSGRGPVRSWKRLLPRSAVRRRTGSAAYRGGVATGAHAVHKDDRELHSLSPTHRGKRASSRGTGSASRRTGSASRRTGSASRGTGSASRGTGSASRGTGSAWRGTGSASRRTGSASRGTGSASRRTGSASRRTGSASRRTGSASRRTGSASRGTGRRLP